jgi:anionic cell wall polymer biosynthesis LytR-Cps2A-Psr (LCP) family protein
VNVLFLSIDRSDEKDEWLKIYRSDVISLACFDLDTNKVDVLSIPRDTLTYVPVEGKNDKINHAYAFGSLEIEALPISFVA